MDRALSVVRNLACAVCLIMLGASSALADATWQGAQYDLNADWSAAANWNGDVPTGGAVATIGYSGGNTANARVLGLRRCPKITFTHFIFRQRGHLFCKTTENTEKRWCSFRDFSG